MSISNKHILNFHNNVNIKIPQWVKSPYRLILGVGDSGNIDNFDQYNVYIILPEILNLKICQLLKNNISKIHNQDKIICFIDVYNNEQLNQFVRLFYKKCQVIDPNGMHCVAFPFRVYPLLLTPNGRASGLTNTFGNMTFYRIEDLLNQMNHNFETNVWNFMDLKIISDGNFIKNIDDIHNSKFKYELNNLQKQLFLLIMNHSKDINITNDVWDKIQFDEKNHLIVINKLLRIVSIIMFYKKIRNIVSPLEGIICFYKRLNSNTKRIDLILHYP